MCTKSPLLVVLLLGLATSLVAAATPPEAQSLAVSALVPSVTTPAVDFDAAGTCPGTASTAATMANEAVPDWLASSSCCRPQCWTDSNCDAICGPGNGVCRQVNSCCKACLCLAAS
jgi:hypothetical protein